MGADDCVGGGRQVTPERDDGAGVVTDPVISRPRQWVRVGWCLCDGCGGWLPDSLKRKAKHTWLIPKWIKIAFEDRYGTWLELRGYPGGEFLEQLHNSGPDAIRAWLIMRGLAG